MRVLRCKFYGRIVIKPRRDITVHVNDAAKCHGEGVLSKDLDLSVQTVSSSFPVMVGKSWEGHSFTMLALLHSFFHFSWIVQT